MPEPGKCAGMSAQHNRIILIEVRTPGAGDFVPTVTAYLPQDSACPAPAVVIFAGWAYKVVCQYESAPTARRFVDHGFAAFVVQYSCLPAAFPQSLCEGLWTIRYVREHADEWGVDPGNITAMGFSAGGHLAACISVLMFRV